MKDSKNLLLLAAIAMIALLAYGWAAEVRTRVRTGNRLPLEAQELLHRDDQRELVATTHRRPGLMTRPIFQVWQRANRDELWLTVLTIENAQDAPIGPPVLKREPNGLVLTDEQSSFEFDLNSDTFRRNDWPDLIYRGPLRCCEPPY